MTGKILINLSIAGQRYIFALQKKHNFSMFWCWQIAGRWNIQKRVANYKN
jgi:hypothetical protein